MINPVFVNLYNEGQLQNMSELVRFLMSNVMVSSGFPIETDHDYFSIIETISDNTPRESLETVLGPVIETARTVIDQVYSQTDSI